MDSLLLTPWRNVDLIFSEELEEKLRAGSEWQDNGLVFTNSKGTPLDAQNVVNRSFKPLLEQAELPTIRFHDLRHTCATLMLSQGVNPKMAQEMLGHANISTTIQKYKTASAEVSRSADRGGRRAGIEAALNRGCL
jgi:integrase